MSDWISVKDRLPTEKDGFVLNRHESNKKEIKEVEVMVYTPKGTGSCISIDNFILGENRFIFDKYADLTVTHWMPLPQPPTRKMAVLTVPHNSS